MSADVVNLQAQVESVLAALVKVATVELTKLFESRYRASPAMAAGRTEDQRDHDTLETPAGSSAGDTKRSIGVQVDGVFNPKRELPGTWGCLSSFTGSNFLFKSMAAKSMTVHGCSAEKLKLSIQ